MVEGAHHLLHSFQTARLEVSFVDMLFFQQPYLTHLKPMCIKLVMSGHVIEYHHKRKRLFSRFVALTRKERGFICYDIIMAYRHDMLHAGLSVVEVRRGKEQRDAKSCGEWNH